MGKRDRERVERILRGEEEPRRNMREAVSEKVLSRVEGVARRILEKTVAPKWAKMDLSGQVKIAKKMMRAAGMMNFRSDFLKNFPGDLDNKKKQGMSGEDIMEHYWGCPEFVEFWRSMELNKDHLTELIKGLSEG